VHKHPYPHYAYVESGTLTIVQTDTARASTSSGDVLPGDGDAWHYGINKEQCRFAFW